LSLFQDFIFLRKPSWSKVVFHLVILYLACAIPFFAWLTAAFHSVPVVLPSHIYGFQLPLIPSHFSFHRTAIFNFDDFLSGKEPFFWTEDGISGKFYRGLGRSLIFRKPPNLRNQQQRQQQERQHHVLL